MQMDTLSERSESDAPDISSSSVSMPVAAKPKKQSSAESISLEISDPSGVLAAASRRSFRDEQEDGSTPPIRRASSHSGGRRRQAAKKRRRRRGGLVKRHVEMLVRQTERESLRADPAFHRMALQKKLSRGNSGLAQRQQHEHAHAHKVDILASYSPRMLISRFADDSTPPSSCSEMAVYGAVVFVDVSGFTALSEALSKEHGPIEGAELLNLYINAYEKVSNSSQQQHASSTQQHSPAAPAVLSRSPSLLPPSSLAG